MELNLDMYISPGACQFMFSDAKANLIMIDHALDSASLRIAQISPINSWTAYNHFNFQPTPNSF